jgi:predicted Zn-dependent protease
LSSQNPSAIAVDAAALFKLGRVDECIARANEFRRARPDDILALQLLAQAYSAKGNKAEATSFAQRAAALSKEHAGKLCQTVQSLRLLDKPMLALNLLKRALKYDPASVEARALLTDMAASDKDAESFRKELK